MPETINVGDYIVTILPRLGGGTFGQVYKATHAKTKEDVAVKQIQLSHDDVDAHDSRLHDMAQAEIDALRCLQEHPNIVKLIRCITKDDSVFLVMEFCDLRDVSAYLKKNKSLDSFSKVKIMKQSASAIAFMHAQARPIIHRDIKLENILLKTENGEAVVKIADFGLAMLCDEEQWGSKTSFANAKFMSSMVGTQYFQAPELLLTEQRGTKYDASVDVFALGLAFEVIFDYGPEYTILCPLSVSAKKAGRMVSLGNEMLENRRKKERPPVIEEILPTDEAWVKDLKNLLLMMTKYRPRDRKNVQDVSTELDKIYERLINGSPTDQLPKSMVKMSVESSPKEDLSSVSIKKWTREMSVDLPSRPSIIRQINGEIYQCHRKGITVFDPALQKSIQMDGGKMGEINDVAAMPKVGLVVASHKGLFQISAIGEKPNEIDKGNFTGVVYHAGQVFAANSDTCGVHVYEYKGCWSQRLFFSLNASKKWIITLDIGQNDQKPILYACLTNEHRVDILSLTGKLEFSTGSKGSGKASLFQVPFMGTTDTNGGALIADYENNRLQTMSGCREWKEVSLQPQVKYPGGAVLHSGKLYVPEGVRKDDKYHLHMYQ